MEGGVSAISVPNGGGSFMIIGSHIEGQTSIPIYFGDTMYALLVQGGYMGANTGAQVWQNVNDGVLEFVTFWNQVQSVDGSAAGLDIGVSYYTGTSTVLKKTWIAPTFTNGYSDVGSTWATAGYRKDRDGIVHLKGMVTATANNNAFQLPAGFRPAANRKFVSAGVAGEGGAAVVVTAGGNVTCYRATDGTVDLSCVSFPAGA
jgi:hypothetical protein